MNRKEKRIHECLSGFLKGRTPKQVSWYVCRFRLLAECFGFRTDNWKQAIASWVAMSPGQARSRYKDFTAWMRGRFNGQEAKRYPGGFRVLTRYLRDLGLITWEVPKRDRERYLDFLRTCPPRLGRRIRRWLWSIREKRLSRRYLTSLHRALVDFGQFLAKSWMPYENLDENGIVAWVLELRSRRLLPETIGQKLRAVRRFYRWLVSLGAVPSDPTAGVRWRDGPRTLLPHLEEYEVRTLIRSASHPRDRAIIELLYANGCWTGELRSLDVDDVCLKKRWVRYTRGPLKPSVIPMNDSSISALRRYLPWRQRILRENSRPAEKALFINRRGKRLAAWPIERMIRTLGQKANLARRVTPRVIRHSFAAHILNRGADIRSLQDLLGHANPILTSQYQLIATARLREVYDRTHPRA